MPTYPAQWVGLEERYTGTPIAEPILGVLTHEAMLTQLEPAQVMEPWTGSECTLAGLFMISRSSAT